MLSSKELREKRADLVKTMRELVDKIEADKRDFNADELKTYEGHEKDLDGFNQKIARADKLEKVMSEQNASVNAGQQLPGREDRDCGKEQEERDAREGDEAFAGDDGASIDDWRTVGESGPSTRLMGGNPQQQAMAMQAWMRYQQGYELSKRHQEAAKICRVNPRARFLDIPVTRRAPGTAEIRDAQKRALATQLGTAGGYSIPEGFQANFEAALLQFGGIRQAAEILRTATGNPLPWPTANDTSNTGALLGENTAVATNVDPTFGSIMWNAYKFTSKMILVPVELLEDSAFDLPSIIGGMCGERIGRSQANYFTTGTGAAQPTGIVTAIPTAATVTTASATAIAYDELVDLVHKVDPAYRTSPSVGFMFHDLVLSYLSKLKDGNGKPIWDNSQQGSLGPNTIKVGGREYPFIINQSMASTVATGNKTALFGDLRKYKIRDVASVRLRRLVERYADSDQEGFVAFARADGNLLDAGTHPVAVLKQL